MDHFFENAVIIGVGLLGGSLGLALKQRGLAKRVHGVGRNEDSLETALNLGAIDDAFLQIPSAVQDAEKAGFRIESIEMDREAVVPAGS